MNYIGVWKPSVQPEMNPKLVWLNYETIEKIKTSSLQKIVDTLFPQPYKTVEFYYVYLNLRDLPITCLTIVSQFFSAIGQFDDICGSVIGVVIEGAYDYKIEKLIPGLKEYYENAPIAQIKIYYKTINKYTYGLLNGSGVGSIFDNLSTALKTIKRKITQCVHEYYDDTDFFSTTDYQSTITMTYSTTSVENGEIALPTLNPIDTFWNLVVYDSLTKLLTTLYEKWKQLDEPWPPLGVTSKKQILKKDFAVLNTIVPDPNIKVLELNNVDSVFGSTGIVSNIKKFPNVQCIVVKSYNESSNVDDICKNIKNHEYLNFNSVGFKKDSLKFIDLTQLQMKSNPIDTCGTNIVRFAEHSDEAEFLNVDDTRAHKLYWIFSDYLNFFEYYGTPEQV